MQKTKNEKNKTRYRNSNNNNNNYNRRGGSGMDACQPNRQNKPSIGYHGVPPHTRG